VQTPKASERHNDAGGAKPNGIGTGGGRRLKPRPRPPRLEADLALRLRRAEGQLRGIAKMVESGTYCIDLLQQISAVRRALDKIALILLQDHIETCVADALAQRGSRAKITELIGAIDRFLA
jgi:CsoR family transcriptional regulator, copper-sensing transcriptional repressor